MFDQKINICRLNVPGDLGSIPGYVIPKILKMVLDTSLLNTQRYKVCIKGKVKQSGEMTSAPLAPWCSSYWKGSLLVALDYGHQLYFLLCLYNFIKILSSFLISFLAADWNSWMNLPKLSSSFSLKIHKINKLRLQILEALHIKMIKPRINIISFENSNNILKGLFLKKFFFF